MSGLPVFFIQFKIKWGVKMETITRYKSKSKLNWLDGIFIISKYGNDIIVDFRANNGTHLDYSKTFTNHSALFICDLLEKELNNSDCIFKELH